jgi:membrane protein CcdC involved in cytochrome C biogenesis
MGLEEEFKRVEPVLNSLSQRVEIISLILTRAILKNCKSGKILKGSSAFMLLLFLFAPLIRWDMFTGQSDKKKQKATLIRAAFWRLRHLTRKWGGVPQHNV